MQLNQKMIMLVSLVIGAISFFLINQSLQKQQTKPIESKVYVIAADKDLQVGVTLNKTHLRKIIAPEKIDMGISFTNGAALIGQIVRNPIRRGDPITDFDVVSEDDNMAGLIPEGYRAATIPISLSDETVGFLRFGNRVDVLFTGYTATAQNKSVSRTQTVIKNALVMKITTSGGDESNPRSRVAYVTLAVKPEWAETLSYAQRKGKIDLLVRPISDSDIREDFISLDELLGNNKKASTTLKENIEVEVIRKSKKETVRISQ
jgi:pilus assembly protein CpaB